MSYIQCGDSYLFNFDNHVTIVTEHGIY